jgi:hypothetical protein
MSRYEIRQLGDAEAYDVVEVTELGADEARYLAVCRAALIAYDRQRCWSVTFVDTDATPPLHQEIGRLGKRFAAEDGP